MSGENHEATARDETYDNFPIEGKSRSDVEWVGTVRGGQAPQLYEEHTNQIYETEVDEESETIVPKNPEPLGDRSLGEYVEEVADEHGWDSLSSFAEEHLESGDEE